MNRSHDLEGKLVGTWRCISMWRTDRSGRERLALLPVEDNFYLTCLDHRLVAYGCTRRRPPLANPLLPAEGELAAVASGFICYGGEFEVYGEPHDARLSTRVDVALMPNLVGEVVTRRVVFTDPDGFEVSSLAIDPGVAQLVLRAREDAHEFFAVRWQRVVKAETR
jgi:hypothetical protein